MNNDVEKVLYTQDQVNQRLDELANTLTEKYQDEFPVLVSVMTGAIIFTSEMMKRLNFKLNVDYVDVSSYEESSESTGKVKLIQDLSHDIKGRPVIIMEDIIDTGRTLQALSEVMKDRGAASVEVVAMLDKPDTRVVDFHADYYGFQAPDAFLVGYGLDYNGLYRNLPYVGILKRKIYA